MQYKARFNQSVEGVETVEVIVDADTFEDAADLIERGDYTRYKVVNNDFTRIKHLGTVELEELD